MTSPPEAGIYILGFGGHARSVADVALAAGVKDLIFVDANARRDERFAGFPTVTILPMILPPGWKVFPAIGDNLGRKAACSDQSALLVKLISPTATIGTQAQVGPGTLVAHHAHVGPAATVGRGVIINTGAIVEHECKIADFSHISVNATVAGRAHIGSNVFIGAGATVIDKVSICDDVIVGAGATVVDHIVAPGTYVGTPAHPLKNPAS
ncbi:acetyltransferase [Mesorhizobium sp. M1C.F.Ca.ET.193.01.1.1]|uniref:acetyltransferase n=1 Tax=unclassified Mesorhizobium TaxID=325217 RepID=UPI000FD5E4E5|nr:MULTISPECIES: acetyltransferase [unclassified Mesorhizobium]TGS93439.1 acetyltransferase [bacterium M00.F.Ca.ET.177.01.1.1]TGQ50727.1 acetyltransferase [Mesorhizobium sp. M1C.F.Ca.ET.210.01.1.1]TGQ65894.1 acetyltransferase [Mesorhizobium sp. M1C.F.Ca.ET.212.01.1.1]TGQ99898.1 acetyltransferase [Mesorhizobium sp. M1C.F.Ca.ET.204.01.1.1]TGR20432.1 acetyltransferase [Mesorhizobium sp. M1C.F.Ca.ET.196.01.1.1]